MFYIQAGLWGWMRWINMLECLHYGPGKVTLANATVFPDSTGLFVSAERASLTLKKLDIHHRAALSATQRAALDHVVLDHERDYSFVTLKVGQPNAIERRTANLKNRDKLYVLLKPIYESEGAA